MRLWRCAALLVASAALAGCGETLDQKIHVCWLDGIKTYPQGPDELVRQFVHVCMGAKGYLLDSSRPGCAGNDLRYYDPACYNR